MLVQQSSELKDEILLKFQNTFAEEKVYEGAKELIKVLQDKGLKVGVITNGKRGTHEKRIEITGLQSILDFVFYGDNFQKPDQNPCS